MYFMFIMQCPKVQDKESVVGKVHIKYGVTYPSITIENIIHAGSHDLRDFH